jgi:hypothetical protein
VNASERPIRQFITSSAILIVIALSVLGFGVHLLFKSQPNVLAGSALTLAGACVLFAAFRSAGEVFQGKSVLEETVSLSLPGRATYELSLPSAMSKGRVILFFEDTTERYAGKIALNKMPADSTPPVSVNLPRLKPSQIKVPKWSPTSDAGETLENWPRRTGQSTEPVMLEFSFPVEAWEKLKLEFELESNFKGTKLERRFPITGKETVRVFVKE